MVAFSDLTQVMQNARTDAKTLDEYVHGAADTQVTSRLGKRYWTLATLDNKLSLVKIKAEKTLADIDTLAKSATDSITAKSNSANTTFDSKVAQANTAIDSKVASIDTRANNEIANLQSAINTAAAAGAGANGWADILVQTATGETQQQRNKRTFSILDYFTESEFDAYKVNTSTFDATDIIKRALLSADILDCDNVPLNISSSITVRENCKLLNINLTNLNTMESSVLVNSNTTVTGKIKGSGATAIERGIYAATVNVSHVTLGLTVTNLTVGVQVSNADPLTNSCTHWHGALRFKDLVGGGPDSSGYGVLLPHAKNCNFLVFADNVPRHDVYLSAGATDNEIICYSKNSKGSPLSIASYSSQEYNTKNDVTMHIDNCTPQSTSSKYAAVITGKSKHNDIYIYGRNSAGLDGALVFRSLASDAVCHDNYAYVNWTGGSASTLCVNEASFNNDFDIVGEGGTTGTSAIISANDYENITTFNDGIPAYSGRLKSLKWDANKFEAGQQKYTYAIIQATNTANFDIGDGVLKSVTGFAGQKVAIYLLSINGYTHKERIATGTQTIAANSYHDFVINYMEAFGNESFPNISLIAPNSGVTSNIVCSIVAKSLSGCTVRVVNNSSVEQPVAIIGEVTGY